MEPLSEEFSDFFIEESVDADVNLDDSALGGDPKGRKIVKFEDEGGLYHHNCLQQSYSKQMDWWENEVSAGRRCRNCWLKPKACFCATLNKRCHEFEPLLSHIVNRVNIMIYYHYLEIGRSPNTAHVFEAMCPSLSTPVIFGDSVKEIQLLEEFKAEYLENRPNTCILYPSSSAIPLSQWMAQRATTQPNQPMRFIALDGTYSHAQRQYKHLKKAFAVYNMPLPLVKLDLGDEGCKSAISGIMRQPEKDKICSYQAIILALKQAGLNDDVGNSLLTELDRWLQYMIKSGIKKGKVKLRFPKGLADTVPIDHRNREIPVSDLSAEGL